MRTAIILLSGCFLFTGCIDITVHVRTQDDGSGRITVNGFAKEPQPGKRESAVPLLNTAFNTMRRQLCKQMGVDFENVYDRAKLERLAGRFGEGVRLQSSQAVERPDGTKGFVAIYSFKDANQLRIGPKIVQDFVGDDRIALMDWTYGVKYRNDGEQKRLTILPPKPVDRRRVMSGAESLGPLMDTPGFLPFVESCLADARMKVLLSFESEVRQTNGAYRHATNPKLVVLADIEAKSLVETFTLPRLLEIKTPADVVPIHTRKADNVVLEHPTRPLHVDLK